MLSQFTVKNYRSIRDEATFDLQATSISEHQDRVIKDRDGELFLPVSAIYGPNGGGKTNVLAALQNLSVKVLRPLFAAEDNGDNVAPVNRFVIEPFAFLPEKRQQPTEFSLFFRTAKAEYRYIMHVQKDIVLYESLDRIKLDTGRRSALFVRNEQGIIMKGAFARVKVSEDLSATLPILSYLGITYKKNEIVKDVIEWFQHRILFLNYGNPQQELKMFFKQLESIKGLMLQMSEEMDLNIIDFRIEEKDNNKIDVFTKHLVAGYEAELNLAEESSGTRKVFGLLPYIASSLLLGATLVIDELDAKLHPLLLRYIIMLFNDLTVNRNGAQLVFTSHDLSTMNNDVFRRDEIWFVAKGNDENSQLYSLVEFKNSDGDSIRKDAMFAKQYLEGKYGADPYFKKIIDWGKPNV